VTDQDKLINEHMEDMAKTFGDVWQKNATMMSQMFNQSHQMMTKNLDPQALSQSLDPMNVGPVFSQASKILVNDPMKLMEANYSLWKEHLALMQQAMIDLMKNPT